MQIAGAGPPLDTRTAIKAREEAALRAALIAPRPDRSAVAAGASRTMAMPAMRGSDQAKAQAKAKVQQILERLKILRKLYAFDPKRMAQALAQVFKELKAAVKAYAKAGGDELGAASDAAGAVMGASAQPPSAPDGDAAGKEGREPAAVAPTPAAQSPSPDHALYDAVTGEVRKAIGEDGLDFVKSVRALSNDIAGLLETARTQARAKRPEKSLTDALDDADKSLASLRQEMAAVEQDIHAAAPEAGLRISVAA
jgi:hypothetical protein